MIVRWSGREAHALRQAMRMSIDDFARHAEVSPRSVARWAQRGAQISLRWDVQRLLDRVLANAGPEVDARLAALLLSPPTPSKVDAPADAPPTPSKVDTPADAPPPRLPKPPQPLEPPQPPSSKVDALVHALLAPPQGPEPAASRSVPRLIHLERSLAGLHMAVQSCRYAQAGADLPALMRLIAGAGPPDRRGKLAADANRLAADLLLKLGDVPMAMLAAQRAEAAALTSEQPLAVAAATRATVRVLIRCGRSHQAAALARGAAENLATVTSLAGPRPLSGYGALLLGAAVAHATAGQRGEAMTLIGEASGLADRLGDDANYGWTAFTPANVALHRISALLCLGDPGTALHIAKELDPQRIRLPERKAAWHLDTARACHTLGRHAEAGAALRDAGDISPGETRAVAWELGLKPPQPSR